MVLILTILASRSLFPCHCQTWAQQSLANPFVIALLALHVKSFSFVIRGLVVVPWTTLLTRHSVLLYRRRIPPLRVAPCQKLGQRILCWRGRQDRTTTIDGVGVILMWHFTPQRPRSHRRRVPFARSLTAESRGIPRPTTAVRTRVTLEWRLARSRT